MKVGFVLSGMTLLRYFMPIVREAKKLGIESVFFIDNCTGKYNSVTIKKNFEDVIRLANLHEIELLSYAYLSEFKGTVFQVEGDGWRGEKNKNHKNVSITYMTDFIINRKYEKEVDFIVAPSKDFAERNGAKSDKFVFLGSPKYDVSYSSDEEIMKKYSINGDKHALVVFPRIRDLAKINITKIYAALRDRGYKIIVKTRGKDPIPNSMRGDNNFSDFSWFPHSSLELIKISDVVINFSSTVVKECVMLDTPLLNFHIKPFARPLDYLYKYSYNSDMSTKIDNMEINEALSFFEKNSLDRCFEKSKQNHLFDTKDVCTNILKQFA